MRDNTYLNPDDAAPMPDIEQIKLEIKKRRQGRSSPGKNLFILAITILIFFRIGIFETGAADIAIIIAVLAIHEAGHLIAMRLFGYKDVRMFFIPMLGAAVSGRSYNVPTYKKAIVCLLGPVPGILIGLTVGAVYLATETPILLRIAIMFIAINTFNLLPFFPLDGGRFLREILFSRNRHAELIFKIVAAAALVLISLAMGAWILAIFAALSVMSIGPTFKMAKIADTLSPLLHRPHTTDPPPWPQSPEPQPTPQPEPQPEPDEPEIPSSILLHIVDHIRNTIAPKLNNQSIAFYADEIWERMNIQPASVLPTTLLLLAYVAAFITPCIGTVVGSVIYYSRNEAPTESQIIEYETPDGGTAKKEQLSLFGQLISEIDITEDETLYHGPAIYFNDADPPNNISQKGQYKDGRRHKMWLQFDDDGEVAAITTWDNGRFISHATVHNGKTTEIPHDQLPHNLQQEITHLQNAPPQGPQTTTQYSPEPTY